MTRLVLLACMLLSTVALAGEDKPESRRDARLERVDDKEMQRLRNSYEQRALRHHPFVDPLMSDSAFPTSHFGTEIGAGLVTEPSVNEDTGETGTAGYIALLGKVEAGVRLGKWVGLHADVGGAAGVGGDSATIIDAGAAAGYTANLGVTIRLFRSEKSGTMLSLRPKVHTSGGTELVLGPGIEELTRQAENGDIDLNEVGGHMVRGAWGAGAGGSLNFAQAFGRAFGLQASLEGAALRQGGTYYDGQEQTFQLTSGLLGGGAGFTFDANPVPIALLLEYRYDQNFASTEFVDAASAVHGAGFGIYLNGMTSTIGLVAKAGFETTGAMQLDARLAFRSYF